MTPMSRWRGFADRAEWGVQTLVPVVLLGLVLIAGSLGGCGDRVATDANILTIVRVEERLSDASWTPVSGATVNYQIFASRPQDGVHIPIYQEYSDTTDDWGLSAVRRDPDGKNPGDIGLVFVEVTHVDGRTLFRRWKIEKDFDFAAWFSTFAADELTPEDFVDRICQTVDAYPDCARSLDQSEMVAWGRGALMRFQQGG